MLTSALVSIRRRSATRRRRAGPAAMVSAVGPPSTVTFAAGVEDAQFQPTRPHCARNSQSDALCPLLCPTAGRRFPSSLNRGAPTTFVSPATGRRDASPPTVRTWRQDDFVSISQVDEKVGVSRQTLHTWVGPLLSGGPGGVGGSVASTDVVSASDARPRGSGGVGVEAFSPYRDHGERALGQEPSNNPGPNERQCRAGTGTTVARRPEPHPEL
jgi:hypothetical protein